MPTAEAVARYLLHLAAQGPEPAPITQMQLHKLLYYTQGWSLATRGTPLFPARFEAWAHGPVEAGVYPVFSAHGASPIPPIEARDGADLAKPDKGFVESIWLEYGRFAAWQLRAMTHAEAPWQEARRSVPEDAPSRSVITESAMSDFFRGVHEARCRKAGVSAADLAQSRREAREGRGITIEELRAEAERELLAGGEPRGRS